jgi:hypothetical protein
VLLVRSIESTYQAYCEESLSGRRMGSAAITGATKARREKIFFVSLLAPTIFS